MCVRGEQEQASNQPEGTRCRILAERPDEYTCRGSSKSHTSPLYQPSAILCKKQVPSRPRELATGTKIRAQRDQAQVHRSVQVEAPQEGRAHDDGAPLSNERLRVLQAQPQRREGQAEERIGPLDEAEPARYRGKWRRH